MAGAARRGVLPPGYTGGRYGSASTGTRPGASAPAPAAPAPDMSSMYSGGGGGGGGMMPSAPALPVPGASPVAADTSFAAPAMQGLQAAVEDPAAGYLGGAGGELNPHVGRRTPPQAMRLLSQLSRVY